MRFSALRLFKEAMTGHKGWAPHWRDAAHRCGAKPGKGPQLRTVRPRWRLSME